MDIRHAISPEQMKSLDTEEIRKQFLIEGLFRKTKSIWFIAILTGLSPEEHARAIRLWI